MNFIFRDEEHKKSYYATLELMRNSDCYRKAVAYLFTLDPICFEHIRDIYDFSEDCIAPDGLNKAWQTGTSKKTTRLAFNLWNGWCTDGETYIGSDGFEESLPSCYFTPNNIFCCEYAPYYVEALKLRFPEYFD